MSLRTIVTGTEVLVKSCSEVQLSQTPNLIRIGVKEGNLIELTNPECIHFVHGVRWWLRYLRCRIARTKTNAMLFRTLVHAQMPMEKNTTRQHLFSNSQFDISSIELWMWINLWARTACGSSTSRRGDLSHFECTWFQCLRAVHTIPYDSHSFMRLNYQQITQQFCNHASKKKAFAAIFHLFSLKKIFSRPAFVKMVSFRRDHRKMKRVANISCYLFVVEIQSASAQHSKRLTLHISTWSKTKRPVFWNWEPRCGARNNKEPRGHFALGGLHDEA
jgi:hypothetical protein